MSTVVEVQTVAPPTPIVPAPATAPRHSLLTSAQIVNEPDDRWMGGMAWVPEVCGLGWSVWDPRPLNDAGATLTGDDRPLKAEAGDGADESIYQPFFIELEADCSAALHQQDLQARARRQLEGITPMALEAEFWDGSLRASNFALVRTPAQYAWAPTSAHERIRDGILNPSYSDGSTLTAVSPAVGLKLLSAALARSETPARGMIHAPAPLVEAWNQNGALERDGTRLITRGRGDIVACYSGGSWAGPTAVTGSGEDASTTALWAYATGPVQIRLSEPEPYQTMPGAFKRRLNRIAYRIERVAAVTVDPCGTFAVQINPYT